MRGPERTPVGLISVVGGESTGKTSLAAALGARLPALVVPESLREWVERNGRVPVAAEQSEVMTTHRDAEAAALVAAGRSGNHWVVSDSGPLMTAVYSIQYYRDDSLLPPALEWTARSAQVVWCQDDFCWQPDPQRDGAHARIESQRILGEIFGEHPELAVIAVGGSLAERVEEVMGRLGFSPPGPDRAAR